MVRIGLTGGIASGKSVVAEFFAALGAPIVDTDQLARQVVEPGEPGLAAVAAEFGRAILTTAGTLDRAALRRRVFADDQARKRLETILHPLIRSRTLAALNEAECALRYGGRTASGGDGLCGPGGSGAGGGLPP